MTAEVAARFAECVAAPDFAAAGRAWRRRDVDGRADDGAAVYEYTSGPAVARGAGPGSGAGFTTTPRS